MHRLAGAKNLSEMVELQAAYWQKLLGALTSQAEEVRALSAKVAAAAGEPLKEQDETRRGRAAECELSRDGNTPRASPI